MYGLFNFFFLIILIIRIDNDRNDSEVSDDGRVIATLIKFRGLLSFGSVY